MRAPPEQPRFAERSASYIGTFGLAGRLLDRAGAFGQVLLIAAVFGSTIRADLYFIASIVPLSLGNIVGEAMSSAVLARAARESEPRAAERLFAAGFWLVAGFLAALTAVYLAVVAVLVPFATPAGSTSLLPWIAFAPLGILFGLGTYCVAPLIHFERYVWPALRGAAATLTAFALTLLVVALGGGVVFIGLAVSTGYGLALLLLLAELRSIGRLRALAWPTRGALDGVFGLRRKLAASAASGVIGGQGLVLIERLLAAPLGVGAVASISYARGVAFTPAMFGQAIAGGVYPSMLRAHAADARDFVRGRFVAGLRLLLFVALCCGAYLALYSRPVTGVLFDRGPVTADSLEATERSLLAFSLALLGWMLTIYTARLFAALNLFRGLVLQELVALAGFVAAAFPLREAAGVPGVALAFALGQVAGGSAAIALVARRLGVSARTLAWDAAAPALARALPVAALLGAAHLVLSETLGAPRSVVAAGGLLALAAAAAVALWTASWPELESLRGFVRRLRRRV